MVIYIGIDPGKKGGLAAIDENGWLVSYIPMPPSRSLLVSWLKTFEKDEVLAAIEGVHSMPKQGVVSTFTFGKDTGVLIGICSAFGYDIIEPDPRVWKNKMVLGKDRSKEASISACKKLHPNVNLIMPRCRTEHDGVAEAILIAEYGRKTHKRNTS